MNKFESRPIQETTEQVHNEWLERQFEHPEIIELAGGTVELLDIIPEQKKTEIPTIMAPGWGNTPEVYKYNMLHLASSARRVIGVRAPHGIEAGEIAGEMTKEFPAAELRKVAAILNTLDAKGIEKVDVVAHSEAGIYMIIAATLAPEKFRNIVLVNPGGIIGEDSVARLGVGFVKNAVTEVVRGMRDKHPEKNSANIGTFLRVLFSNPTESLKQVLAISNSDIREMLKELKDKGIGISIVHAVDDKGFPMERVQKVITPTHTDGFYSIKGTHNEIFLKPQTYSPVVEYALSAMEKKQERTSS